MIESKERALLREWRETYGGSTHANGKPVSADLEARTDALLAQSERASVPVAWIEHHKGGDNLVWEQTNLSCTPLYAASPTNEEQG